MADRPNQTLIPYLSVADGRKAMDWYGEVFGAKPVEEEVFEMEDGRLGHATLLIGEARLYLADEYPEMNLKGPLARGGTSVSLLIYVEDADATCELAVSRGGSLLKEVQNQHGSRSGWIEDPWGHRWSPTSDAK